MHRVGCLAQHCAASAHANPTASTSGRATQLQPQHRCLSTVTRPGRSASRKQLGSPCRVTNTSVEIFREMGEEMPEEETELVDVNFMEVHNPELGPMQKRVGKFYLEELFNDSGVDLEETAYWFHRPPGGWTSKPIKMQGATEAPVTFPEPVHMNPEGRVPFEELKEGTVIVGTISDVWLYHGIQVDFGTAVDGLVPITQDQWMEHEMRGTLLPGVEVKCRIHKLRRPGLYRWPVQLELLEPQELAVLLDPPETYHAPIDHGWCVDQGWDMQRICRETGRTYEPGNFLLGLEHHIYTGEIEEAYGYDHPDNGEPEDERVVDMAVAMVEPEIMKLMSKVALGQRR